MKKNNENNEAPIRPFEVDGIQESDNPLPKWWVGLYILCAVYGIIYLIIFHVFDRPDHLEQFETAMKARSEELAKSAANVSTEDLDKKLNNEDFAAAGKEAFAVNCTPCHNAQGEGGIGANLTDNHWIHGGSPENILKVIQEGVLDKGMPAWKDILGRKKVEQLTALIISWRGKNIPGKAAEGEPYSP